MTAQIVAHEYELLPPRARRLHDVDVVSPWTGNASSEQHFLWQPSLVFRHVRVAHLLERLDRGRSRVTHCADPDQHIDDGLSGRPRDSRPPSVLVLRLD